MPQKRLHLPHAPQPGQASSPRSPLRETYHGSYPGATCVGVLVYGGAVLTLALLTMALLTMALLTMAAYLWSSSIGTVSTPGHFGSLPV